VDGHINQHLKSLGVKRGVVQLTMKAQSQRGGVVKSVEKSITISLNLNKTGHWNTGKRNGKQMKKEIEYYDNGQKWLEGHFVNGLRHGRYMQWHDDGELCFNDWYDMDCRTTEAKFKKKYPKFYAEHYTPKPVNEVWLLHFFYKSPWNQYNREYVECIFVRLANTDVYINSCSGDVFTGRKYMLQGYPHRLTRYDGKLTYIGEL